MSQGWGPVRRLSFPERLELQRRVGGGECFEDPDYGVPGSAVGASDGASHGRNHTATNFAPARE